MSNEPYCSTHNYDPPAGSGMAFCPKCEFPEEMTTNRHIPSSHMATHHDGTPTDCPMGMHHDCVGQDRYHPPHPEFTPRPLTVEDFDRAIESTAQSLAYACDGAVHFAYYRCHDAQESLGVTNHESGPLAPPDAFDWRAAQGWLIGALTDLYCARAELLGDNPEDAMLFFAGTFAMEALCSLQGAQRIAAGGTP